MRRATVVIPTYNRRPSLGRALRGLERQALWPDHYEVVVVLDGGNDDSESWLQRYRPPFELRWRKQENGGLAAARNLGAREARNEVLVFLDDDVIAGPDLVAAHLRAHEIHPNLVVQGYTPIPEGRRSKGAALVYARSYEQTISAIRSAPDQEWHLWSGNISVRRETFERVGGFDPLTFRNYGGEDTDFGLRAVALGARLAFEPRARGEHHHQVRDGLTLARQAYHEGASRVRLARRHGLPLESFPGCTPAGWQDRLIVAAWMLPWLAETLGRALIAGLWLADRLPSMTLRILLAKMVGRHFRLGGIERTRDAQSPVDAAAGRGPLPEPAGRAIR